MDARKKAGFGLPKLLISDSKDLTHRDYARLTMSVDEVDWEYELEPEDSDESDE